MRGPRRSGVERVDIDNVRADLERDRASEVAERHFDDEYAERYS
jgi:hypothetical protein